jgi:hypothetical protein
MVVLVESSLNMITETGSIENKYDYLDDEYDFVEEKFDKPVNYNMATLKRVEGAINRHRNEGRLK